jgi:hypothetical protein
MNKVTLVETLQLGGDVVRVTKEFFNTSNLNLKLFSHIKRLAIMGFG